MDLLVLLGACFLIYVAAKPQTPAPATYPPSDPDLFAIDETPEFLPENLQTAPDISAGGKNVNDLTALALIGGAAYLLTKDQSPDAQPDAGGYQPPAAGDTVPAITPPARPNVSLPPEVVAELPTDAGTIEQRIAIDNPAQAGSYDVWIEPYNAAAVETGSMMYNPFNPDFAGLVNSRVYDKSVWVHFMYWVRHWISVFDESSFSAYGGKTAYWNKLVSVLSAVLSPAEIGSI